VLAEHPLQEVTTGGDIGDDDRGLHDDVLRQTVGPGERQDDAAVLGIAARLEVERVPAYASACIQAWTRRVVESVPSEYAPDSSVYRGERPVRTVSG
jgi:hypothetical protein